MRESAHFLVERARDIEFQERTGRRTASPITATAGGVTVLSPLNSARFIICSWSVPEY